MPLDYNSFCKYLSNLLPFEFHEVKNGSILFKRHKEDKFTQTISQDRIMSFYKLTENISFEEALKKALSEFSRL